jgi:hypothetical protein
MRAVGGSRHRGGAEARSVAKRFRGDRIDRRWRHVQSASIDENPSQVRLADRLWLDRRQCMPNAVVDSTKQSPRTGDSPDGTFERETRPSPSLSLPARDI